MPRRKIRVRFAHRAVEKSIIEQMTTSKSEALPVQQSMHQIFDMYDTSRVGCIDVFELKFAFSQAYGAGPPDSGLRIYH